MQKSGNKNRTRNIAIFASGRGSNAKAIFLYFKNDPRVSIKLIVSNNPKAAVLDLGKEFDADTFVVDRKMLRDTDLLDRVLDSHKTDLIVLAGFLWLIPQRLIDKYPSRIVNIHPALLPDFGGKGMYGMNVHHAVKNSGAPESGITIHLIDEHYDKGEAVFKAKISIERVDSASDIAAKVLKLEHYHYPRVIEKLLFD